MAVGLYLNSYVVRVTGTIDLFRIAGAARLSTRDELRNQLGMPVFVQRDDAYTYMPPNKDAEQRSIPLSPARGLALFALREALLERCTECGAGEAWPGKAGELQAKGLLPPIDVDRFRLESVTGLRLSSEEFLPEGVLLTVRHRRSWRTADSLADPELAARAPGSAAVRIAGDGPARGHVDAVGGGTVRLRTRDSVVEADASHYALAATTALVASWRGSPALRQVRAAVGDVMQNGRANPASIRDRFKVAGKAKKILGDAIPIRGDGEASIAAKPVTVRLEVTR